MFISNEGSFPDSEQGKYQRSGVLWQNEDLNKKVREFVLTNASVKGKRTLLLVLGGIDNFQTIFGMYKISRYAGI